MAADYRNTIVGFYGFEGVIGTFTMAYSTHAHAAAGVFSQ